jgi:3-hydroxy-9,10-secoandrosta-1,3,5(10)-triene-9,17-dione monooxygenase
MMPKLETRPIAPPEPDVTPQQMLSRAEAMRPALRERQAVCEHEGRIAEQTQQEFVRAGFYRILQPRMFGGYEFSLPDFLRIMIEVSRGCSDSGWVLTLTAGHPVILAALPEQGQRELYGDRGECRVPGVARVGGLAVPVPGGYQVKGVWDSASGIDIATHFMGNMMVVDPETKAPRLSAFVVFKPSEYTIVRNWSVFGMQGTGSHRVAVEERIVPEHRVLPFMDPAHGEILDQPGRALHENPLYHASISPVFLGELVAVSIGTAKGALDLYREMLGSKKSFFPPFPLLKDMADYQYHAGEAQALIDTAEAALLQVAADHHEHARRHCEGTPYPPETLRRLLRTEQECVELAWRAVDRMFRTAGTSAASPSSPLGRCFRNLAVIRTHPIVQFDRASINLGRLQLGLDPVTPY